MKSLSSVVPVMAAALMLLFQPAFANDESMVKFEDKWSGSQMEELLLDSNGSGVTGKDVVDHRKINCFPHICG